MGIREEIVKYIDGNSLVTPNLYQGPARKGSDNGPCYTSEYYIMLSKMGLLTEMDKFSYQRLITQCMNDNGMLNRVPVGQEDGQEGVDDYFGVVSGSAILGITTIPREFLVALIKNFGFLNNSGGKSAEAFYARSPQLIVSMISAAFPKRFNILHLLVRAFFWKEYLFTALIIATSCIGRPLTDADSRRLSWHLIQSCARVSIACKLASLIWFRRLYKDYGSDGMKGVAKMYYAEGHPFRTYWCD